MRLTFRAQMMTVVCVSALACALCIATNVLVSNHVEHQLTSIRANYLPKVDLEPELTSDFERLRRAFQDAVASRDLDSLSMASEARRHFTERLDGARLAIDPHDGFALLAALDEYFGVASDVSRRLIAGETGEALVTEIEAMQAHQGQVSKLIERTAAFDRRELTEAFASVARAQRAATSREVWISAASLVAVVALSVGLSRGLLRSFSTLVEGFERFGGGDFTRPIAVEKPNEMSDVARHANQMALNLGALARERDRAEAALKFSNVELKAFSYSVAHDLRAPLRTIIGFSRALVEDSGDQLNDEGRQHLERITSAARRMSELIDALLGLSQVSRADLRRQTLDLTALAKTVMNQLQVTQPERTVEFVGSDGITANGDPMLLRAVLENLLGNAWKFTARTSGARITFGTELQDEAVVYCVRDNGAGFDETYANKLFAPFQRLHKADEFPGTGIGLATVQRIISRHGGRIWAEGAVNRGAAFFFTLPPGAA